MDCQKNTARLQRMKKIKSRIKPIKTGRKFETTSFLGCKDYTQKFKPQE